MLGYLPANQTVLAKELGLKIKALESRLDERGQQPTLEFLLEIAETFGLPPEFALHGWRAVPGWEPNEAYIRATSPPVEGASAAAVDQAGQALLPPSPDAKPRTRDDPEEDTG